MSILLNNFSNGAVSKKVFGRPDLKLYNTAVSELKNFNIETLGGITRREGLKQIKRFVMGKFRLIDFSYQTDRSFVLIFSNLKLRIYDVAHKVFCEFTNGVGEAVDYIDSPYTENEIYELQFTQGINEMYFAHKNHRPRQLLFNTSFELRVFVPYTNTDEFTREDENFIVKNGRLQYITEPLFKANTTGTYPSCVAFCNNRLFFASSINNPYKIWASSPFDYANFITRTGYYTESLKAKDRLQWKTIAGENYYIEEEGTGQIIVNPNLDADDDLDTNSIYERQYNITTSVSADNGFIVELGGNKSERIMWLAVASDVVIGTTSGEWVIDGEVNPTNLSIKKRCNYGSIGVQAVEGENGIFYMQTNNKVRRLYYNYENRGYVSEDITELNDEILESGAVNIYWQRVVRERLFVVLKNGKLGVLTYNNTSGVNGWGLWDTLGEIKSVCVVDSEKGQNVYAMVDREILEDDGITKTTYSFFEEFKDGLNEDFGLNGLIEDYESSFKSLPIETNDLSSIAEWKEGLNVKLKCYDTEEVMVGWNNARKEKGNAKDNNVIKVYTSTNWQKDLRLECSSIGNKNLNISLIIGENRNG